jgi:hypothetical protein
MSAGGGGQGREPVLTHHWTILLCPNSVNNILQILLDNRQHHLHAPLQGGVAKPELTQGLLDLLPCLLNNLTSMVKLTNVPNGQVSFLTWLTR